MAGDTLEQARRVIEDRLKDLRREVQELEGALRRLGNSKTPSRPSATRSTARKSSVRRGSRRPGQRAEQFKQALAKQPGAAVSEISKKLGISSQQGHGIAKRLREKGEIKKQGKGYAVK
jgi:hypothetical protein